MTHFYACDQASVSCKDIALIKVRPTSWTPWKKARPS